MNSMRYVVAILPVHSSRKTSPTCMGIWGITDSSLGVNYIRLFNLTLWINQSLKLVFPTSVALVNHLDNQPLHPHSFNLLDFLATYIFLNKDLTNPNSWLKRKIGYPSGQITKNVLKLNPSGYHLEWPPQFGRGSNCWCFRDPGSTHQLRW